MSLTALANLYCTEADVQALLSTAGEQMRLDDDDSGSVSPTELAYLNTQGINYATSRVNFYAESRYDAVDLAQSWMVNEWATIIATRWLCTRRGNPVPKSIQDLYEEAVEQLKDVWMGRMSIPDIGARNPNTPAWSNMIVRPGYLLKRARVERQISENSPTSYPQQTDWDSQWIWEI